MEETPQGDAGWLTAAIQVMEESHGWARSQMRHVLTVIADDYTIEKREERLISAAVAQVTEGPELRDASLTHEELAEAVMSILGALLAYLAVPG